MLLKRNAREGFTLIELLVVIAIIGILSAIVLAALGSARTRALDAAVKGNLDSVRAQAEIFANSGSYAGMCASSGTNVAGPIVLAAGKVTNAAITYNNVLATAGSLTTATCHENGTAWAVEAPLTGGATMWCIDSTGQVKSEGAGLSASQVSCT